MIEDMRVRGFTERTRSDRALIQVADPAFRAELTKAGQRLV